MRVVVAYDIPSDRTRARVAKALTYYLTRVQKSVFEGDLSYQEYTRMKQGLIDLIDHTQDSVRIYNLSAACAALTEEIGIATYVPDPDEDEVF